jgi:peroxiredoxin
MKYIFITLAILLSFKTDVFAQAPAKVIPSFTFKRLNKKEFTNKELEPGKLLFFVFFDSECDHCQRSIQYIGQHYGEFKETAIYLITLDSLVKIDGFMNKYGVNLKNKKNVTILQDTRDEFIRKFGPVKYPSLFLYSANKELILYEDSEQALPRFPKYINATAK